MHVNANHGKCSVLLFPDEKNSSCSQEQQDPFELVADELSILGNRLRSMVVAEVSSASYSCQLSVVLGCCCHGVWMFLLSSDYHIVKHTQFA